MSCLGKYLFLLLLSLCYFSNSSDISAEVKNENLSSEKTNWIRNEKIFKASFHSMRLQQLDAVESILNFQDYEKQYKIVHKAVEKIFEIMEKNKVYIEGSGYIPGADFPTNESVAEALGLLLHNTALYGELQLKLPDITDRIMTKYPQWLVLVKWAIGFSNSTGLLDVKTSNMINLLCQEMNLIEKSESFYNPYRKHIKVSKQEENMPKQKKKKLNFKKGPRLSKPKHSEL